MRPFLLAAGFLATLAAAQVNAGYFVVRIILEGGGGAGGGAAPGGPPGMGEGGIAPAPMLQPGPAGSSRGGPMGPPVAPGGPMMGGPATGGDGVQDHTRSIFVVVPVTKSPEVKNGQAGLFYPALKESSTYNPRWPIILHHPFGSTNLLVDSTQIQLYSEPAAKPGSTKTFPGLVLERHKDWLLRSKDDTQKLLDILSDALEVGLVDEAEKMATDLLTAAKAKKGGNTPAVERFVTAFETIQPGLRARVQNPGEAPLWMNRIDASFSGVQTTPGDHYHMVTTGGTRTAEVQRRLAQLETNFRAFYLWHAARGVALPLPDRQLPVILAGDAREVGRLRQALDVSGVVADGYYAPDHDVLVLSPERMDEVGMTFQRQVKSMYQRGVNRERLLHPESYKDKDTPLLKLNDDGKGPAPGMKAVDAARMMTWAMADAYNQYDTELAAATREGSRQLFYASGLMPKHVSSPAWLAHGSAEFFHRPRGAVFTDGPEGKTIATVGLAPGYGAPNFAQQKLFRDLQQKKLLPPDPAVMLKNVVTDAYFAAVTARLDADDPKLPKPKDPPAPPTTVAGGPTIGPMPMGGPVGGSPPPLLSGPMAGGPMTGGPMAVAGGAPVEDPVSYARRRQEFLVNKARSTSWALYHHLATNHPAELRRYFEELAKLPRDMPFDGTTNWDVFVRAFNLTTTGEAGKVPVSQFAADWITGLASQRQTGEDLTLHNPPPPSANTTPGGMPMTPMGRPGPQNN